MLCRVVLWENNKIVWWCGGGVVTCKVVGLLWIVWYLVGWVVDRLRGWGMRERVRELYPDQNCPIHDRVLTVAHTPAIHETVYLILVF